MDDLQRLLRHPLARPRAGVSLAHAVEFERVLGLALPASWRALYLASDGVEMPEVQASLLSLAEARKYASVFGVGDENAFGYVALTDLNDSDPHCLCTRGPLAGYVVRLRHDGEPSVAFRSLETLLRALLADLDSAQAAAEPDDADADEDEDEEDDGLLARHDFRDPARTHDDVKAAHALVAFAGEGEVPIGWKSDARSGSSVRLSALRFAMQLFSERETPEVSRWLLDGDEYVREAARWRLEELDTQESRRALREADAAFHQFVERAEATLRRAGLPVKRPRSDQLRVGTVWLNLPVLFGSRLQSDFETFLVERVRALVAMKP